MRTCTECGSTYPEDRLFCPQCGGAAKKDPPAEQTVQSLAPPELGPAVTRARPGKITFVIVGLNAIMFLVSVTAGKSLLNPSADALLRLGSNYGPKTLDGQWWRLVSYMFLHAGVVHFVLNMWALLNLGLLAELLFRRRTFLAIYFLSGIGGGAASLWWHPLVSGVGASGAIFGLAGAVIPGIYLHQLAEVRRMLRRDLISITIFVGYSLVAGAFLAHIDNAAHLGGLTVGLLLGLLLHVPAMEDRRSHAWRDYTAIALMLLLVLGMIVYVGRRDAGLPAYVRATDFARRGLHQPAIAQATKAIEKNRKYTDAYFLLGSESLEASQNEGALSAFQKVVELAPQQSRGYMGACIVKMRQRKFQEAAAQCKQATDREPNNPEVQFNLGLALFASGDTRGAVAPLKTALKLRERYPEAHYILGAVYLENQQFQYAVDELKRAIELRPNYGEARMVLAQAYVRLGMRHEADQLMRVSPPPASH